MTFEDEAGSQHPDPDAVVRDPQSTKLRRWQWTAAVALISSAIAFAQVLALNTRVAGLESEANSLFRPPVNMEQFIQDIKASTVVIECEGSMGSGWVIDLGSPDTSADPEQLRLDKLYPTDVITNHHVVERCLDSPGMVKATAAGTTYDAWLYSWDQEHDLALVGIKQAVPALPVSGEPLPGHWVMALGSPYGLEGSVSIGNVINTDNAEVITSAPFNSGNSGGPLVNSRGHVVGTSTWSRIGDDYPQDWNVAEGIPMMCFELVDCGADEIWTWGYEIESKT